MMEETTFPDYASDYTSDPIFEPCNKEDVKMFVTLFSSVINSFIFIFGIIGNCLVLWIIFTYETLESLTNVFILNLSIADLILTSCLPFFSIYQSQGWVFGATSCKVFNILFSIGFYSGLIFLTFLTFHRYLAVVDPLSALKAKKPLFGVLITVLAWMMSIVVSVPVMIFQVYSTNGNLNKCEYDHVFPVLVSHYQQNVFFLIAFSSIIFCYYKIVRTLQQSRSQRNHKPVRLISIIVLVYFLSWTPYNVAILLQSLHHQQFLMECELIKHIDYAKYVSEKLALSHCVLNPILYALVGIKFRRHFKHLINKCYCSCKQEELHSTRISSHDQYHNGIDSVY